MARYRATLNGGSVSRLGHAKNGISAAVNGWTYGLSVQMQPCGKCGEGDRIIANITRGGGHVSHDNERQVVNECSNCDKDKAKWQVDD